MMDAGQCSISCFFPNGVGRRSNVLPSANSTPQHPESRPADFDFHPTYCNVTYKCRAFGHSWLRVSPISSIEC